MPAGFTVETRYNGTSRLYSGNSEVAPRHTVGIMARKKLLNDKLLLAVSVDNIFNQANEYASTLDTYRVASRYVNGFVGRVFKVALTWSFDSGRKIKKGKIEVGSGSERGRLREK
ncbi:outer membrane beta-barrel protein [uncultured Parabacteroides sp.]|uniref:outer membrane beta-barrel protein n=1 Tax=uncultured Parabacteroides sp. TaxID=512312 RepID=UPI002631572E|nr:outer membrane beta-barrel protein [uncultured Parabacteroides sp.]